MSEDLRPKGNCPVCYQSFFLDSIGNLPWHFPTIRLRATRGKKGCPGSGRPPVSKGRCPTCSQFFGLSSNGTIPSHSAGGKGKKSCTGGDRTPRDRICQKNIARPTANCS